VSSPLIPTRFLVFKFLPDYKASHPGTLVGTVTEDRPEVLIAARITPIHTAQLASIIKRVFSRPVQVPTIFLGHRSVVYTFKMIRRNALSLSTF
jgi:hypothetical protein